MNKNNFHVAENTDNAKYKLWMLIKFQYVTAIFPRIITRYSLHTGNDQKSLQLLMNYIENRKHKIEKAELYDNQKRWQPKKDALLKVFNQQTLMMEDYKELIPQSK